jgi:hypothetical protein
MDINVDLGSNSKRLFNTLPVLTLSNSSDYAKPLSDGELPYPPNVKSANHETSIYKYSQMAFSPPASYIQQVRGFQEASATMPSAGLKLSLTNTTKLVWEREKYMNEDLMLFKKAAGRILQIINSHRLVFNTPTAVKKIHEFGNPAFELATSSVGGYAWATLEAIYDIYTDPTSMALIQRLNTVTYVAYPKNGASRNVIYQFATPVKKSAEVIVPFKY